MYIRRDKVVINDELDIQSGTVQHATHATMDTGERKDTRKNAHATANRQMLPTVPHSRFQPYRD